MSPALFLQFRGSNLRLVLTRQELSMPWSHISSVCPSSNTVFLRLQSTVGVGMTDYRRCREADVSAVYKSRKRFICGKALIVNGERALRETRKKIPFSYWIHIPVALYN